MNLPALDKGPAASVGAQAEINHWRELAKELEQTICCWTFTSAVHRAMAGYQP